LFTAEKLVFVWTGNHSVEVKEAIHVGGNETVCAFEELADLDFRQIVFIIWAECTFLLLVLVILNVHISVI